MRFDRDAPHRWLGFASMGLPPRRVADDYDRNAASIIADAARCPHLHPPRTVALVLALEFTPIEAVPRWSRRRALDVVRRRRWCERRQVLAAGLGCGLETRREFDEYRFAESGAQEADAERQAEHRPGRPLNERRNPGGAPTRALRA